MTSVLLLALAPTFFVMLLGYSAGRLRIVNNMHVAELNIVVMTYALPTALFLAVASTKWSALVAEWALPLSLAVMMMVTYAVWYLYQRLGRKQDSGESALQSLAVGQPNFAAAGFPVITALVGPGHLSTVALAIAAGSLLPSPVTLALLELDQRRSASKSDTKDTSKSSGTRTAMAAVHALSKPIVLAPVFGLFVSWIGWSIPKVIETSLQEIGSAAGGMALFVTGLVLSQREFHLTRNALLGVGVANVVQPLLTFALCIGIGADVEITKLSVVMAALPSGFFGVLFGTSYGRPSSEANSTIIASTIFSAITLAVAIAWTYSYRE